MASPFEVLNIPQGSPEWLALRGTALGGSDAAAVLEVSLYKTPHRLWMEKTGRIEPEDLSRVPHVRLGKQAEPLARSWYEDKYDVVLFPTVARSIQYPYMMASFDGLDDYGHPVEIKCPTHSGFNEVLALGESSELYLMYRTQVDHQLIVSGASKGYLAFFRFEEERDSRGWIVRDPVTRESVLKMMAEPIIFTIERDEKRLAAHVTKMKQFWNRVSSGKAPKADPARDIFQLETAEITEVEKAAVQRLVDEYVSLDDEILALESKVASLKQRQGEVSAEVRGHIGTFSSAKFGNVTYSRYSAKGNVDWKALSQERGIDDETKDKYRGPSSVREKWTRVAGSKSDALHSDEETNAA